MNSERARDALAQRDAAASARNARPIFERAGQQSTPDARHWQRVARKMFEQGHEEPDVMAALRQQGARTYAAADACAATRRHYRNVHHMAHRREGLRGIAVGLAMCVGGCALMFGVQLFFYGCGLLFAGLGPLVVGLYKVLSGSSTPLVLPQDMPR